MRLVTLGLAALAAAALTAPRAVAQHCCGGAGGGVGPRCSNGACGGILGLKAYPFSEERYIRQFCGPHIAAGSCFGYFKPQITPWGEACPLYGDARADALASGPYRYNTPAQPAAPTPPARTPAPAPRESVPMPTIPQVDTPESTVPPKPPSAPPIPKL